MNELFNDIILLVIGTFLGVVATVVVRKILGGPDPKADAMKVRQTKIGWPWQYTADEPPYLFPREINDSKRNEIFIHFQIPLEYYNYKENLILTLYGSELHGDDFSIAISAKHANGNFVGLGTVKFDNQSKGLKKNIVVPLNLVGPGANTFHLKNASPPFKDRWLFWDYLSLMTNDNNVIWEIGKENGSWKEFHDLRFGFP